MIVLCACNVQTIPTPCSAARLPISAFCSAVNFTYDALLLLQGDCSCDRDSRASIFPPALVIAAAIDEQMAHLYSVVHEDPVACRRAGRAIKKEH